MTQPPDPDQLQSYLSDVAATMETMRTRIQHLESQTQSPATPAPSTTSVPVEAQLVALLQRLQSMTLDPHTSPIQRSERHPDPSPYSGQINDLERFVSQLNNKLEANADRYSTERERVIYAYSRLAGKAAQDLQGYFRPGSTGILTVPSFVEHLERRYGDPFKTVTARAAWLDLRQRNSSFIDFLTQFENLANIAGISDSQRMKEQLEHSMSREMKRHLIYQVPYPDTFQSLAMRCVEIESLERSANRDFRAATPLRSQRVATAQSSSAQFDVTTTRRAQYSPVTAQPRISPATGANAIPVIEQTTTQGGDRMDLSRHRGPISEAEKLQRRTNGLCLYCGGPGHIAATCPQRSLRIQEIDAEAAEDSGKE